MRGGRIGLTGTSCLGEPVKHEWRRDERGEIAMQELGGLHRGPVCLRCGREYCRHCVKVGVDGGGRKLEEVLEEDCVPARPTPVQLLDG